MASSRDSSAKSFLKKAGKYAGRAHEKMLQKMGKVDDPKDESFQRYVTNFNAQHAAAIKLQREVHRYLETMKGWHLATKSLMATSAECYDREWEGRDSFQQTGEQFGLLGEDVLQTVRVQLVEQLDHYVAKFGDLKTQVNKRERKLLDHQRTKRELETIKGKEKSSDVKIQKAEETYEEAEKLFKEVNEKLHEDLPTFYDSRVHVYASAFQGFAQAHTRFFEEATKLSSSMLEQMTKLEEDAENYIIERIDPVMEQSSTSNGMEVSTGAEVETPELKEQSEPEVEQRSSPVPTPVPAEEAPPVGNSPSRDSKSCSPTGSSGDDESQKSASLKRSPPVKPTRPESFSPADNKSRPSVDVRAKPPSLTNIVGSIKPPTTAYPEQDSTLKESDKKGEEEKTEQVLPVTVEEDQGGADGGTAEKKVTEPSVPLEVGDTVGKDEATGERLEQQVEEQPTVEVDRQEQAGSSSRGSVDEVTAPAAIEEDITHKQEEQPVEVVAAQSPPPQGEEGSAVQTGEAEQHPPPPEGEDVSAVKGKGDAEKEGEGAVKGEGDAEKEGGDAEKEGEGAEKEGEGAEKEGGGAEKEVEGAEKEGEGAEKEGEGAEKEGEGAEKEGEGAEKEGEGAEKEGEDVVKEGDAGKGGEDAEKEGEGAEKEGEDVVKEGDAGKGGEDAEKGEGVADKGEGDVEKGGEGAEKAEDAKKGGEGSEKGKEGGGENTKQPPAGVTVLFKVKAIHAYEGEDEDELTLETDDVIQVIPYEDPEEQDEGWLMGICERTGKKGVFPQNFTNKIMN